MCTRSSRRFVLLALASALLYVGAPAQPALAEGGEEARQRVRFQVSSARDVANDWIVAVVGVTAEDADPAALADGINRTMAWALAETKKEDRVSAESGGYDTHPVYEDGRLRRWRGGQTLVLEGRDADAMTALVGTLQSRLQLQSFQFRVAEDTRREVEEELLVEALEAFQERAKLVSKSLGAGDYAIDDGSIDAGGGRPPLPMQARMEMSAARTLAPPAVEGGTSRLQVNVSGSIALE